MSGIDVTKEVARAIAAAMSKPDGASDVELAQVAIDAFRKANAPDEAERNRLLEEEVEQLRLEQSVLLRSAKARGRRMEWLEGLVLKYKGLSADTQAPAEHGGDLLAELHTEAAAMEAAIRGEVLYDTFHAVNWQDKPHRVLRDAITLIRKASAEIERLSGPKAPEDRADDVETLKGRMESMWQAGLKLAEYGRDGRGHFPADAEKVFHDFDPEQKVGK